MIRGNIHLNANVFRATAHIHLNSHARHRVYAEAGVAFKPYPERADLDTMFDKSPISLDLAKITTPTLFHIGMLIGFLVLQKV